MEVRLRRDARFRRVSTKDHARRRRVVGVWCCGKERATAFAESHDWPLADATVPVNYYRRPRSLDQGARGTPSHEAVKRQRKNRCEHGRLILLRVLRRSTITAEEQPRRELRVSEIADEPQFRASRVQRPELRALRDRPADLANLDQGSRGPADPSSSRYPHFGRPFWQTLL
jgi:hypothetical protein